MYMQVYRIYIILYVSKIIYHIIVMRRLDGPRAAGFDRWGLLSIVTGQMADKSTTVLTPFIVYYTLINYYTQLIHNMVDCHNS